MSARRDAGGRRSSDAGVDRPRRKGTGALARRLVPAVTALAALALTLGLAAGVLWLGGYDPGAAVAALATGAAGSVDAFVSVTLVRATPLLLTGLAVAVAFRAGLWNIGAEGQLYAGAVAAAAVGLAGAGGSSGPLPVVLVLLASAAAGAAWAWIPAMMKVRLGVGEVITTILLNFVAIHLAAWLVHGPLQEARGVFPQTDPIAEAARLPTLGDSRLHLGFLLALGLAGLLWAFLRTTRAGFALRAVGGSREAAEISGRLSTRSILTWVFLGSGALAGLAGGVEVAGVTYALYENLSPGHGYTAIAVALLAGLHPAGVVATAVFFGALEGGAGAMQRSAGIPAAWVGGIEALVILSVLAMDRLLRRSGSVLAGGLTGGGADPGATGARGGDRA